jgi:hypothetical protein
MNVIMNFKIKSKSINILKTIFKNNKETRESEVEIIKSL